MNLATVGLGVSGGGAIVTLNQFTGSAHNAGRAGARLEQQVAKLNFALRGMAGYFSTRQLIEYADTWQLINSRINLVTNSQELSNTVQEELYRIAQRTRNTMAATSVLYTRLALNGDQLGRTHKELLGVVSAVNSAMLVSGATGVEAAQSMRQLAQALGAGRLQGDEFRTVMEAMPAVARAISDEMGVAIGDLYKLSREGKIGVDVIIDALLNAQSRLEEQAANMPITIGQSFILFQNAAERMIGILSQTYRAGGRVADGIRWLAENMNRVVAAVGAATAAFLAYRIATYAAAAASALITAAQTIAAFVSLALSIRRAADAMALFQLVGKGAAGAIAVIIAAGAGFIAYRKLIDMINDATAEWEKSQGDLNTRLGEGNAKQEEANKKRQKALHDIADMIRLANQQVTLAWTEGRVQERLQIVMDAVNKEIEARRRLTEEGLTDLIPLYVATIQKERDLLLLAEERRYQFEQQKALFEEMEKIAEDFRENLQRAWGDMFYDIFNKGIDSAKDFFDAVKNLFFRMVAELAAARMMKGFGGSLAGALGAMLGIPMAARGEQLLPLVSELEKMAGQTHEVAAKAAGQVQKFELVKLDANVERSLGQTLLGLIGPIMAGFGAGFGIGRMTGSTRAGVFGGALAGAGLGAAMGSAIPVVGTAVGAAAGGLAGAIGGLVGATNKQREEMERHREIVRANSEVIRKLRDSIEGQMLGPSLARGAQAVGAFAADPNRYVSMLGRRMLNQPGPNDAQIAADYRVLRQIANDLGITLDGSRRAWEQLQEAIELSIIAITQFGLNLQDVRMKQEAYNRLFDVEDSPVQQLKDTFAILREMSPQLLQRLGLTNVDMATEAGRTALLEGLRAIYNMIVSGELTPELLGAFTDKNQLLDAILRVKDGLDAFHKELYKVTTDFPRAMDIIYYEQKFGRYDTDTWEPVNPPPVIMTGFNIHGGLTIVNEAGDDPTDLVNKFETGVRKKQAQGARIVV